MKKNITLILVLIIALTILVGCASGTDIDRLKQIEVASAMSESQ
jgi:uncharacterized protein YcfL